MRGIGGNNQHMTKERFFARACPEPNTGCLLWEGATKPSTSGFVYGSAKVPSPFDGKMMHQTHRIAWTYANGPIPKGLWVLHKCDTPLCVNPDHLFLGTAKNNTDDMYAKGRGLLGSDQSSAKLTADDVRTIRSLHAANPTPATRVELGKRFSVHVETIRCIAKRKRGYWHWLP